MQTEGNIVEIQEIPLNSPRYRRQVENFLAANGLRLEVVDNYFCVLEEDGTIVAGAGLAGDVVKCVAVDASARSSGLVAPLVSHIITFASGREISNLKVFTKPENEAIFASLGFHTIARAPLAILMENGHGLEYYLSSFPIAADPECVTCRPERSEGSTGVIIMNANPFTLGHKYLIEKASAQVDRLFVIPVKEDVSLFPYSERLEMIRSGCGGHATVLEGSAYQISAATFPTYFLKDLSEASEIQMRLDLDLFGRHIAPALGVSVRFVGSEPSDPLTARYNELMEQVLPSYGIRVAEIPRLACHPERSEGSVSAATVRKALEQGSFLSAARLTPPTTWPYLVAELLARALRMELDTPLKPGLVDKVSIGAHSDMDYALMSGSIGVIRRSFIRHLPISSGYMEWKNIVEFGKAVEADVLEYTGGVNTHRGAIFALGLASLAALGLMPVTQVADNHRNDEIAGAENGTSKSANVLNANNFHNRLLAGLRSSISDLASGIEPLKSSHGTEAVKEYGVKGALRLAQEGYEPLFEDWLPFFSDLACAGSGSCLLRKTLLRIMSTLDDTCVIHRVGYERAQEVKMEAKTLLENFSEEGLKEMKARYDAEGISPGGAADMLALTILIDALTN
ncbi:MAG: [Bacteroidales bacterium]|nr:[citrate (pro-3S)-lyase] ligase [Bacteroidales bacterium]